MPITLGRREFNTLLGGAAARRRGRSRRATCRPNNRIGPADAVPTWTSHRASRKFCGSGKQSVHLVRENWIRRTNFACRIEFDRYQEDWGIGRKARFELVRVSHPVWWGECHKCASIDGSVICVIKVEKVSLKKGDPGTLPLHERPIGGSDRLHAALSEKCPAGYCRDLYADGNESVRSKPCQIA
jgi:hypothetical protein